MQVIAVYHNKGGVGKTTVSVNLAAALRKKGKNILLIDIDAQANSTFATGLIKFQFEEDDNLKDSAEKIAKAIVDARRKKQNTKFEDYRDVVKSVKDLGNKKILTIIDDWSLP